MEAAVAAVAAVTAAAVAEVTIVRAVAVVAAKAGAAAAIAAAGRIVVVILLPAFEILRRTPARLRILAAIAIAIEIGMGTGTVIAAETATGIEIVTAAEIVIATGTVIATAIKTVTEIAIRIDTEIAIATATEIASTKKRAFTMPQTMATIGTAMTLTSRDTEMACTPALAMPAVDKAMIRSAPTFTSTGRAGFYLSSAAVVRTVRLIGMVSCAVIRKATKTGNGTSSGDSFTGSVRFADVFRTRAHDIVPRV